VRAIKTDLTVEMNRCPLVPVVLVFTMFDVIVSNIARHNDYESAQAAASAKCEEFRRSLFGNVRAEIVSSNYSFLCIACKSRLTPSFVFSAANVSHFHRTAG
jgi:hypothetical protein